MFSIEVINAINTAPDGGAQPSEARELGAPEPTGPAPDPDDIETLQHYGQWIDTDDGPYIGVTGARIPLIGGGQELLARSNAESVADYFDTAETVDGWIAVPAYGPEAAEAAEAAISLREDYPIFSDDDFSEREWEEVAEWVAEEYGTDLAPHVLGHDGFYGSVDEDNAPETVAELAREWAEAVYANGLATVTLPRNLPDIDAVRDLVVYADGPGAYGVDPLHVDLLREWHNREVSL